jgi:hypothetical protein
VCGVLGSVSACLIGRHHKISVPSLIRDIRDARLLVGSYGSSDELTTLTSSVPAHVTVVDAIIRDGVVVFMDHSIKDSS